MARLKQQARWLQPEHPDAARSLLEGLEETFTINRLGLSPKLRRCLATTNLIESPHSGVRLRTRRVTNWQGGSMVLRKPASAALGGRGVPGDGSQLPPHRRLPRAADAQGGAGGRNHRGEGGNGSVAGKSTESRQASH